MHPSRYAVSRLSRIPQKLPKRAFSVSPYPRSVGADPSSSEAVAHPSPVEVAHPPQYTDASAQPHFVEADTPPALAVNPAGSEVIAPTPIELVQPAHPPSSPVHPDLKTPDSLSAATTATRDSPTHEAYNHGSPARDTDEHTSALDKPPQKLTKLMRRMIRPSPPSKKLDKSLDASVVSLFTKRHNAAPVDFSLNTPDVQDKAGPASTKHAPGEESASIIKTLQDNLSKSQRRRLRRRKRERERHEAEAKEKASGPDLLKDPFLAAAVTMAREAKGMGPIAVKTAAKAGEGEKGKKKKKKVTTAEPSKSPYDSNLGGTAQRKALAALKLDVNQFSTSWGKDELAPSRYTFNQTEPESRSDVDLPPHMEYLDRDTFYPAYSKSAKSEYIHSGRPPLPLSYTRRVEGMLGKPETEKMHVQDLDPPSEHRPIARLAHGLDRVLFNPGVYWLQDPRSHVFNFSPWLQDVPRVTDFDFARVQGFIKSSSDTDLHTLARQHGARFTGSTSSLTGMLSHIYMALSREKLVDTSSLSAAFQEELRNFTPGQKLPTSVILRYKDGVYSTDSNPADPGTSEKNVLTWMGTMLEKFLTLPQEEFQKLLRDSPSLEQDDGKREAYRYARFGSYVMRSQLDCYDPRLPGTGVFDIKTRAALPIRMDLMNWEENSGYLIRTLQGHMESFEREYYDLIRSAFLKYSFQARIGNMDGVFVTYHNTARIFGFQYVPLEEMDERLYGNKRAGQPIFERCLQLLEVVNTELVSHFPGQTISTVWDSEPERGILRVWAELVVNEGKVESGVESVNEIRTGADGDVASEDVKNEATDHDMPVVQKQLLQSGESAVESSTTSESPIIELEVHLINYLDSEPVKGWAIPDAIPDVDWTVHYKLFKSSMSQDKLRARRQVVLDKALSYYSLPAGVTMEQAEEHWHAINYGGNATTRGKFRRSIFKRPDARTKELRKLARQGRDDTAKFMKERRGKPQIVWGEPEVVEDAEEGEEGVQEEREEQSADVEGALREDGTEVKTVEEVDDSDVTREMALSDEPSRVPDEEGGADVAAEELLAAVEENEPQELYTSLPSSKKKRAKVKANVSAHSSLGEVLMLADKQQLADMLHVVSGANKSASEGAPKTEVLVEDTPSESSPSSKKEPSG